MARIKIRKDGGIDVDGASTGYCVHQSARGTTVMAWHDYGRPQTRELGDRVIMPQRRYRLDLKEERAAFDADFLAAWDGAPLAERQAVASARRSGFVMCRLWCHPKDVPRMRAIADRLWQRREREKAAEANQPSED